MRPWFGRVSGHSCCCCWCCLIEEEEKSVAPSFPVCANKRLKFICTGKISRSVGQPPPVYGGREEWDEEVVRKDRRSECGGKGSKQKIEKENERNDCVLEKENLYPLLAISCVPAAAAAAYRKKL